LPGLSRARRFPRFRVEPSSKAEWECFDTPDAEAAAIRAGTKRNGRSLGEHPLRWWSSGGARARRDVSRKADHVLRLKPRTLGQAEATTQIVAPQGATVLWPPRCRESRDREIECSQPCRAAMRNRPQPASSRKPERVRVETVDLDRQPATNAIVGMKLVGPREDESRTQRWLEDEGKAGSESSRGRHLFTKVTTGDSAPAENRNGSEAPESPVLASRSKSPGASPSALREDHRTGRCPRAL
jgi:hypothetical protein